MEVFVKKLKPASWREKKETGSLYHQQHSLDIVQY
jgi:hypothetical protein